MNIHKELEYNTNNIDIVKGVQFGILGPEEIIKRSAVEITTQKPLWEMRKLLMVYSIPGWV